MPQPARRRAVDLDGFAEAVETSLPNRIEASTFLRAPTPPPPDRRTHPATPRTPAPSAAPPSPRHALAEAGGRLAASSPASSRRSTSRRLTKSRDWESTLGGRHGPPQVGQSEQPRRDAHVPLSLDRRQAARAFYYPPPLEDPPKERGVLHAKALVQDERKVLIASANFTEAALRRNIELGFKITDPVLAKQAIRHYQRLIEESLISPLPG